jgi:hypothetical protein
MLLSVLVKSVIQIQVWQHYRVSAVQEALLVYFMDERICRNVSLYGYFLLGFDFYAVVDAELCEFLDSLVGQFPHRSREC